MKKKYSLNVTTIPLILIGFALPTITLFLYMEDHISKLAFNTMMGILISTSLLIIGSWIFDFLYYRKKNNDEVLQDYAKEIKEKYWSQSLNNSKDEAKDNNIDKEDVTKEKEIEEYFWKVIWGIEGQIDRLQRNSVVNLVIGIIGTFIAIGLLSYSIFIDTQKNDFDIFIISFIPKMSFSILIQIFAYFFLRLYRNNLEDIKYFGNELTNVQCKLISIELALKFHKEKALEDAINELSIVERNFKLGVKETLPMFKRQKMDKELDQSIIEAVERILKNKKID